jgi:hypothetical protein
MNFGKPEVWDGVGVYSASEVRVSEVAPSVYLH